MTEEQLEKGKELKERMNNIKSIIASLRVETSNHINFTQSIPGTEIRNISISVSGNEVSELDKSIRIVLEATKHTILSIYKRELNKIEQEFKNL